MNLGVTWVPILRSDAWPQNGGERYIAIRGAQFSGFGCKRTTLDSCSRANLMRGGGWIREAEARVKYQASTMKCGLQLMMDF